MKFSRLSIIQLTLIHLREFYREPGILFWAIGFPLLMAWGLGIAFTKKAETIKHIAYIQNTDYPNSKLNSYLQDANKIQADKHSDFISQNGLILIKSFNTENLGKTSFHFISSDIKQAEHLLKTGKIPLFISEIPSLEDPSKSILQYNFDPDNADSKLTYLLLSSAINNTDISKTNSEIKPLITVGTRYIDFLVPGLLSMGVMMSLLWGVSWGLIDKRNKKLIRRMVVTPMSKSEFLISHFIARFLLSFFESAVLFLFAYFYFGTYITGSIPALILMLIAGNIAFFGIAIFISSRTANPEIGNYLINAIVTPMMVVSGVFFSYHNFPDWAIPVIKILPLTILTDGIRSIFNEAFTFTQAIPQIIALSAYGIITFIAGLKIYKWY